MPWLLPWLWWTLTCCYTMLQKANMGEQQDGALVPFYQCSIPYQYLFIFSWCFYYTYYTLTFPPLMDPFIFLLFEAPTVMADRAVAVIAVPWCLWVHGDAQNHIPLAWWCLGLKQWYFKTFSTPHSFIFTFWLFSHFRCQWRTRKAYLSLHNKLKEAQYWKTDLKPAC